MSMGKCTICSDEVDYRDDSKGGFKCDKSPGNHKLPTKRYYELNCSHIQSIRDRRKYAPQVILKSRMPQMGIGPNGTIIQGPGLTIQFGGSGIYDTDNAEEQFYLDRYAYVVSGDDGLKRWRELFLTSEQQNNVAKSELEDMNRQIKEQNVLLEQLKSQSKKREVALA